MQQEPEPAGFAVEARPCATCIYRADSPLNLAQLEGEIADRHGGFVTWRICHTSDRSCCRGFWNRHKDRFAMGQIAQRLGAVVFVAGRKGKRLQQLARP